MNSLPFDWALRLRTAGTHVSFTYIQPMPVPPAEKANRLSGFKTRLAWETGIGHITEDESSWPDLWATNRSAAEAYGLGPAEFEHILSTFPGFARKRPGFHAYLLTRVAEWLAEAEDARGAISYETREGVTQLPRVAEKEAESDDEESG
jgi:hypothetical protein